MPYFFLGILHVVSTLPSHLIEFTSAVLALTVFLFLTPPTERRMYDGTSERIVPQCTNIFWLCVYKGGGILPLSRQQNSLVDTGHIYWYILMKCCMVACINILYLQNWSVAAVAVVIVGGGQISGFMFVTCFRQFGVNLYFFFTENLLQMVWNA